MKKNLLVSIVMGSQSDWKILSNTALILNEFKIPHEKKIVSAHRTPDRLYLGCIINNYSGGPVGIDTLSAALLEQRDIIEDVIEPYLMQKGFVQRTPRGRIITKKGTDHL